MGTGLKENRNSWFARIVVTVLAVAFIVGLGFTGNLPLSGVAAGVVAEVNGDSIPISYYTHIRRQVYARQTENLDKVPVELRDAIDSLSLNLIIERKLLAQKARSLGLRVVDEALAKRITSINAFHLDGIFAGPEYYKDVLERGMGLTPRMFEESIRDETLAFKMLALSELSSLPSESELKNLFEVTGEKISIEYIRFEDEAKAREALAGVVSSGDIGAVAEKSGTEAVKTPFFTRFEIPPVLAANGGTLFSLDSENPFVKEALYSDGHYYVVSLAERKSEEPETVLDKTMIAMRDPERGRVEAFSDWVRRLYSDANVKRNLEAVR